MGQAPLKNQKYLIVGDGRLSQHLSHYFKLLNISFKTWSRKQNSYEQLQQYLTERPVVLLAIQDKAILEFYKSQLQHLDLTVVHFSGALHFSEIYGFHPLMTFSDTLYSLETYQSIGFISTPSEPSFESVFPNLTNPNFKIPAEKKALYHSYCVVAGNFSNILWKAVFERFQTQLQLPQTVLKPYLQAVFENIKNDPTGSLTGPLARDDHHTIEKNLESLSGDALKSIYLSFYEFYQNEKKETPSEHLEL